jgi:hypothetical protein
MFLAKIDEGKIYVGKLTHKPMTVTQNKKTIQLEVVRPCRILDIRHVLIAQLHKLLKKNALQLASTNITIPFRNWWDGTSLLDSSFFAMALGFLPSSTVFTAKTKLQKIMRLSPWLLGFVGETCETVAEFKRMEGSMIASMKPYYATINGVCYTFTFKLALECCDHSAAQKGSGNNNGGHKRCELCAISFHPKDIKKLLDYTVMLSAPKKDLASLLALGPPHTCRKEMKELGQRIDAPLLNGDFKTPLSERNLDLLKQAPDNLHNIKGTIKVLIKYERAVHSATWNESLFLVNVAKHLGRHGTFWTN